MANVLDWGFPTDRCYRSSHSQFRHGQSPWFYSAQPRGRLALPILILMTFIPPTQVHRHPHLPMDINSPLLSLPPEVILQICKSHCHIADTPAHRQLVSYLDLPELQYLASLSPLLRHLSQDRALHRTRILVVAPSRIQHALFAYGGSLRPTVADLVHSGVMRGLGIERRWRHGLYFYSPQVRPKYERYGILVAQERCF